MYIFFFILATRQSKVPRPSRKDKNGGHQYIHGGCGSAKTRAFAAYAAG